MSWISLSDDRSIYRGRGKLHEGRSKICSALEKISKSLVAAFRFDFARNERLLLKHRDYPPWRLAMRTSHPVGTMPGSAGSSIPNEKNWWCSSSPQGLQNCRTLLFISTMHSHGHSPTVFSPSPVVLLAVSIHCSFSSRNLQPIHLRHTGAE